MSYPFPYSSDNKRYHTLAYHFKKEFGRRAFKVPVNIGCTCPNRDGTKGVGGCSYCVSGGGGTFLDGGNLPIAEQFRHNEAVLRRKWPDGVAVAYFQSFTNTYLPADRLRARIDEVLALPGVGGIAIGTRADCLPGEILDLLEETSRKTWLQVELGLQTAHDRTAKRVRRCHTWADFLSGYGSLRERGIRVCVHLINGLPGEDRADMIESARRVAELHPQGVKLHMLHVSEGCRMAEEYLCRPFPLLTREEYVSILADQLEWLPPETVVQRVTGDPAAEGLIAPQWVRNKLWVRNALDVEMNRRQTVQGLRFEGK